MDNKNNQTISQAGTEPVQNTLLSQVPTQEPQISPQPQVSPVQEVPQQPTVAANVYETLNQTETPINKPKKPWLIIIIAVILVIIVGAAAYFLLMGGSDSTPITDSSQNTPKVADVNIITDPDIQELDQNLSSIDADLQSVDQGLNDTPEDLTQ
jgi:hypothetical protein